MSIWIWILLILTVGILIVVVSSFINNRKLVIRNYSIENDKIARDCKIVFISDLHGNSLGKHNSKLIEAVKEQRPDLVLIGGDMITSTVANMDTINWENSFSLIEGIKDYTIYYAQGNHEYRMDIYRDDFGDGYDRYIGRVKETGANILANESAFLEEYNINITGLSIDRKFYRKFENNHMTAADVENLIGGRQQDKFEIIMAHNPEYFDTYAGRGDLILSGHLHGGIMKLPLLGGVISPRFRLFPKYDGGIFRKGASAMIVSRGLGSHTLPLRVFNPCELCVLTLKNPK